MATISSLVSDLVDAAYSEFDIDDDTWTKEMHESATSKVKDHAEENLKNGDNLGKAVSNAIREDCKTNADKFEWLNGLMNDYATTHSVDLKQIDKSQQKAHFEKIDMHRVAIGSAALQRLNEKTDIKDDQREYAQITVLFYMNSRAVYENGTRTKSLTDVAADKALFYATHELGELSVKQQSRVQAAINAGKRALIDSIKEFNNKSNDE